ncbi:hypothetical protein BKA59DRAFT_491896 [Fusarium tricinctum]|uniref:DUF7730 domain-containing protein n=1 Tax=Fusarium tricinctum TaxID=61284 RepID=A0A8K0S4A3_9HYPO|nr:hypothetical protein BKA59DRAFT_491896 [Fusarium tricinctum]
MRPNPDPRDDSLPDWRDHVQEMPFLTHPRARALTPTGFRDQIAQEPNPIALFQESMWFKLPPYIRRDILRLAFGDCRVHMSLSYQSRFLARVGSVCHRSVLENQPPAPMTCGGNHYGPWSDSCKSSDPVQEQLNSGYEIEWLTVRNSYAETIDAFYSTHTIAMSGEAMISHIPQLVLPQRLAVITSLEIRWPLHSVLVTDADEKADPFRLSYQLDLDQISIVLDILAHKLFQASEDLAQKLRAFVRSRPGLRECAFALPETLFKRITGMGGHRESYSQVWDSLDGHLHMISIPFENSYPDPPFHIEERQQAGFWLLGG